MDPDPRWKLEPHGPLVELEPASGVRSASVAELLTSVDTTASGSLD